MEGTVLEDPSPSPWGGGGWWGDGERGGTQGGGVKGGCVGGGEVGGHEGWWIANQDERKLVAYTQNKLSDKSHPAPGNV